MWTLAVRNLRTRPARTGFSAVAIALGVALIFAMRIVGAGVEQAAVTARTGQLAGADLAVSRTTGGPLDAVVATAIRGQAGVLAAAPVYRALEGRATTDGPADPLGGN